ncbi:MAG: hypothetical protein JST04_02770 [Bdellovibrionales bacterium]|nr:hypothetical protein [Bdellovibrionales bacterium]
MKSLPFRSALLAFVATAAGAGIAADSSPVRVRIPADLAKEIAQASIGAPRPDGSAHIPIHVKAIDAVVKKVDLTKIDEVIRTYGAGLFGLNFETPFSLPIHVSGIDIEGDLRVREIKFSTPKGSDGKRLGVTVKVDIPTVAITAPEVWAREQGLTPDQKEAGTECGLTTSGSRDLDRFAGNHIWARVFDAKITKSPRIPRGADDSIHVIARFGVELPESGATDGNLKIYPLGIQHDVARVIKAYYGLNIRKLQVPPVRIKVGADCFDGDSSGVDKLFRSMLADLKIKIVEGVADDISNAAMKEATKALAKLKLPAGREFKIVDREAPNFAPIVIQPTYQDHTYVHHDRLLSLPEPKSEAKTPAEDPKKPSKLAGLLWEIHERVSAESLSVGNDGAIEIGLSDSLRVNGRDQSARAAAETGKLPPLAPKTARVILNRSFFEAKTDLIASLRAEQSALLPKEIALGPEGLEARPNGTGKLSLVAHAVIKLKNLTGLKKAFYYLEKIAGNATGTLSIPAQLDVEPSIVADGTSRKLLLRFRVNTNLVENDFRQRSDLGKIYPALSEHLPIIRTKVNEKIEEAAAKLNANPVVVDLAPLEAKAPVRVERVSFTDTGALVVDVSMVDLPGFLKAAKEKKTEAAREN